MMVPDYPKPSILRRAHGWQSCAPHGDPLQRVAHHEAGHAVLLEWFGMDSPGATATPTGGACEFPDLPADLPQVTDETGEIVATAASILHAGRMAEMLLAGEPWRAPIHYPEQDDYRRADDMLQPVFGRHASGAHAFAQRVALHVLSARWPRVQEIARVLIERGAWQPHEAAR